MLRYNQEGNAIAFKIGIRFVVDYKNIEYDVGAGELAKFFPDNVKLFGDECKLTREGKEIVDGLVNIYNGECARCNPIGCVIQMNGMLMGLLFFFCSTSCPLIGHYLT